MKKDRLRKTLSQILNWAKDDLPTRDYILELYFEGNGNLAIACSELYMIGMNDLGKALQLEPKNNTYIPALRLSQGLAKQLVANSALISSFKGTTSNTINDLDGITQQMFCTLAIGQLNMIVPFYQAVITGLENGYGVRDGHNLPIGTTLRYAAFGLTIIGDWLGKPLDLDKHALPRDPAWGQLVAHWREPDPEKLLPILLDACDTHVERIALTSRELDSGNFEFGSPFEAVYPAEILAIKNLRLSLGLQTPFIDHPLMKSPYAMLTLPPHTPLEHDELLEQFLKAACRYNPEAVPEGLYEAVRETGSIG
ncbi:hypothetical protein [uncultured Pseudomonas sp.]|uniref:hypothetical protein n=1 Tax=uncultured Pseudomonas sp. TaxID=114707 RepID=UPI0025FF59D9|nr:hypothetical protein [uncultured Pseudomonas sp.]